MDELISLGINWAKRELLREAGFPTLESLRQATDEQLQRIPGIGPGTVYVIRRALRRHVEDKQDG